MNKKAVTIRMTQRPWWQRDPFICWVTKLSLGDSSTILDFCFPSESEFRQTAARALFQSIQLSFSTPALSPSFRLKVIVCPCMCPVVILHFESSLNKKTKQNQNWWILMKFGFGLNVWKIYGALNYINVLYERRGQQGTLLEAMYQCEQFSGPLGSRGEVGPSMVGFSE